MSNALVSVRVVVVVGVVAGVGVDVSVGISWRFVSVSVSLSVLSVSISLVSDRVVVVAGVVSVRLSCVRFVSVSVSLSVLSVSVSLSLSLCGRRFACWGPMGVSVVLAITFFRINPRCNENKINEGLNECGVERTTRLVVLSCSLSRSYC